MFHCLIHGAASSLAIAGMPFALGEHIWTASDVERSLYSCAAASRMPNAAKTKAEAKQPAAKRKADAKSAGKRPVSRTVKEAGAAKKRKR